MDRRDFLKSIPMLAMSPVALSKFGVAQREDLPIGSSTDMGISGPPYIIWEADYWNQAQYFVKGRLLHSDKAVAVRFNATSQREWRHRCKYCYDIIAGFLRDHPVELTLCSAVSTPDAWLQHYSWGGGHWIAIVIPKEE